MQEKIWDWGLRMRECLLERPHFFISDWLILDNIQISCSLVRKNSHPLTLFLHASLTNTEFSKFLHEVSQAEKRASVSDW